MRHVVAVPWSDEERDRLRQLHSNGIGYRQISLMMGRTRNSVHRQLQTLGLTQSSRNPAVPRAKGPTGYRQGVKHTLPPLPSLRDAD